MKRKLIAYSLVAALTLTTAIALVTYDTQEAQAVRRDQVQTATTSAISWTVFEGDDFDVERITLKWASGPTTNENITITKDSYQGAAYDTVLASVDPAGKTSVVFENINGLKNGDAIVVAYTNTDAISITGVATTYLGSEHATGPIKIVLDGIEQGAPLTLGTSDIEIGAVELKNAATDDRALISDANTARANTDHVLSVQAIDATGKVSPAGEAVANSVFVAVGDDTTTAVVETAGTKKALNVNVTDGTNDMPTGDALARSLFVNVGDGTTTAVVETAGTKKALNVNVSDGTNDMPTLDDPARRGYVQLTDGTTDATVDATTAGLDINIEGYAGAAAGSANPVDVQIGDGTNVITLLTGTVKTQPFTIHDGTSPAYVVDEADDISTNDNGLIFYGKERSGNTAQTCEFNATDDLYVDINAMSVGVLDVQGDDAHDDTFDANPVGIGAEAETLAALSTVNTDGDITRLKASTRGVLHVDLTDPTGASDVGTAIKTATEASQTALEIIDDWDSSDRCSTSPISGQAGVAANTGAMDALTQRVTLATDDPAVVDLAAMEVLLGTIDADTGAIKDAVEIMDDWDETDRAAVNLISGQAGVSANTGAMDAATQRVTLATDDPAVVDLAAMEVLLGTIDADTSTINTNSGTIAGDTTSIDGKTPALGTAVMASSWPFTLATDDTQFGAVGAATDVDGNIHGQLRYIGEALDSVIAALPGGSGSGYKSYIDASFVTGDSPQTHDINTDLGRNGDQGYIANDGAGNISVQISESGAVSGEDAIILKNGETLSLDGWNVDQITVTWVTDSAYRIVMR